MNDAYVVDLWAWVVVGALGGGGGPMLVRVGMVRRKAPNERGRRLESRKLVVEWEDDVASARRSARRRTTEEKSKRECCRMLKTRWSVVDVEAEELVWLAVEEEDDELEEQDEEPRLIPIVLEGKHRWQSKCAFC